MIYGFTSDKAAKSGGFAWSNYYTKDNTVVFCMPFCFIESDGIPLGLKEYDDVVCLGLISKTPWPIVEPEPEFCD